MGEQALIDTSWLTADWHEKVAKEELPSPERPSRMPTADYPSPRAAGASGREVDPRKGLARRLVTKDARQGAGKPVPKPVNLSVPLSPADGPLQGIDGLVPEQPLAVHFRLRADLPDKDRRINNCTHHAPP